MLPLVWSMDLYGVRRSVQWDALPSAEIRLATVSRRPP
jgi:hypothetical protein